MNKQERKPVYKLTPEQRAGMQTVVLDVTKCKTLSGFWEKICDDLDIPPFGESREGLVYQLCRRYGEEGGVVVEFHGLYTLPPVLRTLGTKVLWFGLGETRRLLPDFYVDNMDAPWREEFLKDESYFEYQPIENPTVIDFAGCRTFDGFHDAVQKGLGFPEYYGRNWDALWDCLDGMFNGEPEWTVELHGTESLRSRDMQYMFSKFMEILQDEQERAPQLRVVIVD